MSEVKGYKVFNPDWTCEGYQFEVGGVYEEDAKHRARGRGFHFCEKAADCFNYYQFNSENKVAEILALGKVGTYKTKSHTNKIKIVREIPWHELLEIVNAGKACTGHHNSGDYNSGYRNSGNHNSGNRNSGNRNSGYRNSGKCNSGDWNSGDYNSGDWNSGYRNSGDWNSGDYNSGKCNSGDYNSGNRNSGDWNKASDVVGCFNTESQKLKFFDKETDMTFKQWRNSEARRLLTQINFRPAEWIQSEDMTDEEKAAHPEYMTTQGYLKIRDNTDCCTQWWKGLSDHEKNTILAIPNFDKEIFKEITGIDVNL